MPPATLLESCQAKTRGTHNLSYMHVSIYVFIHIFRYF
jgi:hypothetical protein